jgi:hypothetical protein
MSGTVRTSVPQIIVEHTAVSRGASLISGGSPYLALSHRRSSSMKLIKATGKSALSVFIVGDFGAVSRILYERNAISLFDSLAGIGRDKGPSVFRDEYRHVPRSYGKRLTRLRDFHS